MKSTGLAFKIACICLKIGLSICKSECLNKIAWLVFPRDCNTIIDTHTHIWSNGMPPFEYAPNLAPSDDLRFCSGIENLSKTLKSSNVHKAIIIQPINHGFDHSYLIQAINDHRFSEKVRAVGLLNPQQSVEEGEKTLLQFKNAGFVGVRFNPYLWEQGEGMSGTKGTAFFLKAGDLDLPVGFMCFRGLKLHIDDIIKLSQMCPKTKVVIDHFGFFLQDGLVDEKSWADLLFLQKYPQVYVKISALFRVSSEKWPYLDLDSRLVELVHRFGSNRLMWGTDYPFVEKLGDGYSKALDAMNYWSISQATLSKSDWEMIFSGTAKAVYNL